MSDHEVSIVEAMRDRLGQLRGDDVAEEDREDFFPYQEMLDVSNVTVTTILMGCGGPTDYFDITHKNGEVKKVDYHHSWGEGVQQVRLTYEEELDLLDVLSWDDLRPWENDE